MVLVFSKVQRCNVPGAPNGFYGFGERFDAPEELATQLIAAGVAGEVETSKPTTAPEGVATDPAIVPQQPASMSEPAPDLTLATQEESPPEKLQNGSNKKKR